MIEMRCPTPEDTSGVARRLAPLVVPGDLIVLSGGLGAGKTLFAAALAAALGVEETVVSPTFVLMRMYSSGFMPFVHADVYRLGTMNEFDDLDVFEQARHGLLVVEWGNAVATALPEDHLVVRFDVESDGARVLSLLPSGSWPDRLNGFSS